MYEETTQSQGKSHPKGAEEAIPARPEMFPLTKVRGRGDTRELALMCSPSPPCALFPTFPPTLHA